MKTIVLYGFEGEFVGGNEYDYNHPELHHVHKCILFLAQDSEHPDFEFVTTECSKFGFANLKNLTGKPLKVDVLNTDSFRGFAGFYEEALNEGSSIVYYPNT
ncbi:hypothetical protein [Pseudidiomarina mangrovi]|uniref:hypothetical protein n=1 Tax=Pseudidiomarina mangrovi TaxID=2487133 RepID=UPI000FCB2373|nr:hypothetical protein [Pseudidiomarina mangrovi]